MKEKKNVVSEKIADSNTNTSQDGNVTHEHERDKGESADDQSETVHNVLSAEQQSQPIQSNDSVARTDADIVTADPMDISENATEFVSQMRL